MSATAKTLRTLRHKRPKGVLVYSQRELYGTQVFDFRIVQVVADRFVKSGRKCEPIAPNDVLKALDYFNIPEELWPEGLLAMAAVGRKYDREANQIMHTIKAEMTALVESMDDMSTQKQYAVGYSTSQKNVLGVWAPIGYRSSSVICPLPPSLKERLQCLADDMWFDIKFNPEEIQHGTYRGSKSSTYWSFTVAMHVPSVRR